MKNLESLSAKELDALVRRANKIKAERKKRIPIGAARARLDAAARKLGYTLAELAAAKATKKGAAPAKKGKKKAAIPPKYRNPETGATWAGRGKHPAWLREALASGRKVEEFLIG